MICARAVSLGALLLLALALAATPAQARGTRTTRAACHRGIGRRSLPSRAPRCAALSWSMTRSGTLPPANSIYWGALVGYQFTGTAAPDDPRAVLAFDAVNAGGKGMSVLHFGGQWESQNTCGGYCAFPAAEFDSLRGAGILPFFSWGSTGEGPGYTDAEIAAGSQDAYIAGWARAARAWGHPFFLRFDWEMNGGWFPYGVGGGGNRPADYVAMWHHVHDIFTSVGAANVTWVWCPEIGPGYTLPWLPSLYPGDAYVDWTCLDGYNTGQPWMSFHDIFDPVYTTVTRTIAPSKPMIVGELGSTEQGGSKGRWIADMLSDLPVSFPQIHGILWYDGGGVGPGGRSDWPIDSSPTASRAFAAGISAPSYIPSLPNVLGALPFGPVPVP
jgi:hypothetical protein